MYRLLRQHYFILGILGVVLLAFLFPQPGAKDGPLRADQLSRIGVMVIFFLQGLSLKTSDLARGMQDLRLHAFVQSWVFILSPVVFAAAGFILKILSAGNLADGFFFLALIPTTISSAVVFTGASGGNVAAAIFNTTLSNVFGVFWVPTGCVLLFSTGGGLQSQLILPLLENLSWMILLPLLTGQIIRPLASRLPGFFIVARRFKHVNNLLILFIIYCAFAQSVLNATWKSVSNGSIVLVLVLALSAMLLIHGSVWLSSGRFFSSMRDRKAALFCGSQKTLAAGAPMAVAIFSNGNQLAEVNLSLILLPLLCYHPMQLLLAAILLPRLSR